MSAPPSTPGGAARNVARHPARDKQVARRQHSESQAGFQPKVALEAAGLMDSFGCADLLRGPDGRWLVVGASAWGALRKRTRRDV